MQLSELIRQLREILEAQGDIKVQVHNDPKPEEMVVSYEQFFLVTERYASSGDERVETRLSIRTWPY